MGPKRLELLRELVPKARVIALLVNPNNPIAELQVLEMQEPARSLGVALDVVRASTERELGTAFATLTQQRADALLVANDPVFTGLRDHIVELAARHPFPR
jgi:putative ABC transport system substrate-binding protein